MNKVLVASKDIVLEKMLGVTLTINGFSVVTTKSLREAHSILENGKIDILLLDTQLDADWITSFMDSLKEQRVYVPVLLLGPSRGDLERYERLSVPFDFPSLKLRMNQLFKKKNSLSEKVIIYGDLYIDVSKKFVLIKDRLVNLGREELAILISLSRKTGGIVGKDLLHADLEAQGIFFNTTIQHHLWTLKNKLNVVAGDSLQIKQVLGKGIRLIAL